MSTLYFDQKVLFWMGGRPAGRTEKLGIKPATAQLGLGLGLSLAKKLIMIFASNLWQLQNFQSLI